MSPSDKTSGVWRKSSHSGGGNDCIEIATAPVATAVRGAGTESAGVHGAADVVRPLRQMVRQFRQGD